MTGDTLFAGDVDAPPPDLLPPPGLVEVARSLRAEVAERLAAEAGGGDGAGRDGAVRLARAVLAERAAERLAAGAAVPGAAEEDTIVRILVDMLFGLGLLQPFLEDPAVENIDVIGADTAFVTYADGRKLRVGPVALDDDELVSMVRSLAARIGLSERRFDHGQPELDLRLPDGSRLSAVMAVTERPVVDIRRHRHRDLDLDDLVDLGMMPPELADFLTAAVRAKRNILVSGAMNAGKTTLLRALAAAVPPEERIVTIEQALELGLDRQADRHPDCVAMEARLPNTEGLGGIGMAQLVRRSLRMNASRVIVGEVLGDEVVPMLNAMTQGRSGSMATVHADSSAAVPRRLATYALQAPERLPLEAANLLIAGAVHLIVHLDVVPAAPAVPFARHGDWSPGATPLRRVVASVREVVDADGTRVVTNEVWRPGPSGEALPAAPLTDRTHRLLVDAGWEPAGLELEVLR